jgi:predicted small secreted protein
MSSQFVAPDQKPSPFMCLEDRLLQALYKEEGAVHLQDIADPIAITPNAALSIVHRIQKVYPQYLTIEAEGEEESCRLVSRPSQAEQVQRFLDEGGFTKINEQEFLQYYEKEIIREKRKARINQVKAKIRREKWAIGVGLVVGMGIILATYLHKQKQYR